LLRGNHLVCETTFANRRVRRGANGQERVATKDDKAFLRIAVVFGTPLPPNEGGRGLPGVSERWQPLLEEVYREVVPGTDMVLLVEVASKTGPLPAACEKAR
jgi:hypothetical protein